MKLLPPSQDHVNRTAIFWALLSQSIWLPVLISDYQDQWSAKRSDNNSFLNLQQRQQSADNLAFRPSNTTLLPHSSSLRSQAQSVRQDTGVVLNSVFVEQESSRTRTPRIFTATNSLNSTYAAPRLANPFSSDVTAASKAVSESPGLINSGKQLLASGNLIQSLYSRSELLGGTITLKDLAEPSMPPIARAERAQWSRSGDPLAPLPQIWREPMRRALNSLTNDLGSGRSETSDRLKDHLLIDSARFVHVPSAKVRRASEVPLALQADGTVDILNQPDDPAVIDEINRWSVRQKLPAKGKISPAVVHLHPMEPLTIGRSEPDRPKPLGTAVTRSPEAALPPQAAPEATSITPPAPSAVQEPPAAANLRPTPITSTAPAAPSQPDPAPTSEAES